MNTKRVFFWACFVIILILIIWGLIVAMNKPLPTGSLVGTPAPVSAADHIRGNPNATNTLIEYGDFQCPACETYFYIVERLFNEASTSMRMVFRQFPLSQHANAIPSANASEAAANQGKFWEMYSMLYTNQDEWSEKSRSEAEKIFEGYAEELGLDMGSFKADATSTTTFAKVAAQLSEANNVGIDHTPFFFLNGREIKPNTYEDFKTIIESATASSTQ